MRRHALGEADVKTMAECFGWGGQERYAWQSLEEPVLRIGITLWIALSFAAGPWLCCCSATRVLEWCARTCSLKGNTQVRPCCCHKKAKAPPKESPASTRPDNSVPDNCPCNSQHKDAITASTSSIGSEVRLFDQAPALLEMVQKTYLIDASTSMRGEEGMAFRTAWGPSRAPHLLRC